jgi:hypothetical protein
MVFAALRQHEASLEAGSLVVFIRKTMVVSLAGAKFVRQATMPCASDSMSSGAF